MTKDKEAEVTTEPESGKYAQKWDEEVDVAVAGAGDAGLSAAIESRNAGASTMVFDKLATTRSTSSAMSGGAFSFAGTAFQKQKGIQDSDDLFFKDIMTAGNWKNNLPLVKAFIKEQLNTFNWFTALGIEWSRITATGGMTVPRAHRTDPVGHVVVLKEAAEKKGARIFFRTRVTELITDNNKRVIGVCAQGEGRTWRVKARKGVVLATGGFGRDKERLRGIDPRLAEAKVIVSPGHTGDGHKMAEILGAYFRDMELDCLKPTIGIHGPSNSPRTLVLAYWSGAIVVNKEGNRFVNESMENRSLGGASLSQPEQIVYEILDQKVFDKEQREGLGMSESTVKLMVKAQTIQELAAKINIPYEAFKATISRYNDSVDKGKDPDFGRTKLSQAGGKMIKIDTPPFYAYETKPWMPGTYAGVAVDGDMHVLTKDGIVPGLYGAGELVGGFHGTGYSIGTALSKALVFGRLAGISAAASR